MIECNKCLKQYPENMHNQQCPACGGLLVQTRTPPTQKKGLSTEVNNAINSPLNGLFPPGEVAKIHQFQVWHQLNYNTTVLPVICPICNQDDCGTILYSSNMRGQDGPRECKHNPGQRWIVRIDPRNGITKRILQPLKVIS